jgi:hypothetical protein
MRGGPLHRLSWALGRPPTRAGFVCFGIGIALLTWAFAEPVMYGQRNIRDAVLPLAVIVGSTSALVAPLLLFTPKLFETKRRGARDYGVLAASYTRAFDAKWVRRGPPEDEPLLGSADIQSLADLANSLEVVHHMRLVPIAASQVLLLAAAGLAPAAPLILFVIPFDELIIRGAQLIFPL